MMRALLVAILAASSIACSLSHGRDGDADRPRDAAPLDAVGEVCPDIGGYRACEPLCSADCPEGSRCRDHMQVCLPFPSEDPRGAIVCAFDDGGRGGNPSERYCWDGQICAVNPETFDRSRWGSRCMSVEYCREAAELGIDAPCYYSDHTWFVDGPPVVETCPAPADPLTPFCGGPCGECPFHSLSDPPQIDYDISCVGISERRGVGVCTFGLKWGCREDAPMGILCDRAYGQPCACLMLRDGDGAELERGWVTFESACLAYRAMDPEGVVCHDVRTWEVLVE